MRKAMLLCTVGLVAATLRLPAQTPAADPSPRLREVLPADVAEKVLATIAEARAVGLPAAALEHRALELAAKNVAADAIAGDISRQRTAMSAGRDALVHGGDGRPSDEEVEAAAAAMSKGVDGAQVSELAKSAPSGRSLAVPLFVIAGLMDRGLPADQAIAQVQARLAARASDAELGQMPGAHGRPAGAGPGVSGAGPGAGAPASHPTGAPTSTGPGARPHAPVAPGRP